MTEVVEHLPSKCKALNSNSSTTKKSSLFREWEQKESHCVHSFRYVTSHSIIQCLTIANVDLSVAHRVFSWSGQVQLGLNSHVGASAGTAGVSHLSSLHLQQASLRLFTWETGESEPRCGGAIKTSFLSHLPVS
jgi:hypothetical protein